MCAFGPTYEIVLAGRIITALCHGGSSGSAPSSPARLVTPERQASAIALMFAGLTVANVLGVPAGTALGHRFGWRATFVAVALIGLLAIAAIGAFVRTSRPRRPRSGRSSRCCCSRPSGSPAR